MKYNFTIKQARMYADLTAEEMANLLGVSRSTYLNWETGRIAPRVPQLDKIAEVTGVEKDDIFLPITST